MNIDMEKLAREAIQAKLAQGILESIGTQHRDAILAKSIEDALKDWSCKSAIEKVVAKRAEQVAAEMVQSDGWTARIKAEIDAGFSAFLLDLRDAMKEALVRFLAGRKSTGTYDNAQHGVILDALNAVRKEKEK